MPRVKREDRTQSSGIPLELRDKEKFYCEKCPRSYKSEWDFRVHQQQQCGRVGYKPWKCIRCPLIFTQEVTLREHVGVAHLKKPYTCSEYGEKFWRGSKWSIHKNETHPTVKFSKHVWTKEFM